MEKSLEEYITNFAEFPESVSELKQTLKRNFIFIFHKYITLLMERKHYEEIFNCFDEVQTVFPDDADILNALGICLNRLEKPLKAIEYFSKAVQYVPKKLSFLWNLENTVNQWIPRWHFSMLNDKRRNECFRKAIQKAIVKEETRVLDIGTGSGLLSLYCWSAGAKEIYACEEDEIMSNIARRVFHENGVSIHIIADHSTNINIFELGISRFDLIVTEIFDCGGFGEGVLPTLIHAKNELLTSDGRVIPNAIEIFVAGVQSVRFEKQSTGVGRTFQNSYLKNIILVPDTNEPYEPIDQQSKLKLLTKPLSAFFVDFNNLNSMQQAIKGDLDCDLKLISLEDGVIEGFLVYFNLYFNDDFITNFETSTKNKKCDCWDPIVFPLDYPMSLVNNEVLNIKLSCKDGILKLTHNYKSNLRTLTIEPQIVTFLSDLDLIDELEHTTYQALKQIEKKSIIIGDFMSFPHIGMKLLRENKVEMLYCSENVRHSVNKIAEWNNMPNASVTFMDEVNNLSHLSNVKFDLVLLQPITGHSTLNDEQLKQYKFIKNHALKPHGVLIPHHIDICCKLISSNWLDRVSRVNTIEDGKYGIEKYMNEYATKHQFDFTDFQYTKLSKDFTIATVQFDEGLYENKVSVDLFSNEHLRINGILYFYKIYFMSNSAPFSTYRKRCFSTLNCYVVDHAIRNDSLNVTIDFIQNEYLFRCFIKK